MPLLQQTSAFACFDTQGVSYPQSLPTNNFVDRIEAQSPKRMTSRRLTPSLTTSTPESQKIVEKRQITKKRFVYQNGTPLKSVTPEDIRGQIKRGKRTLTMEKEKNTRKVKVLRRSHLLTLSFKECDKTPIKVNKTL